MEAHSPFVGTTPRADVIAGLVMPEAEHVICFHALTAGACWVELADNSPPPMRVTAGDVVVVAKGDSHYICSSPGMRGEADLAGYRRPADRRLPIPHVLNQTPGGTETCHFVCGYLGCDLRPFNPLFEALPRLFHAQASITSQGWLSSLLRVAVDETEDDKAGRETMLSKLAEFLFVDVLRKHIGGLPEDGRGWLSAVRDRHIGAALRMIHGRPSEDWTLETLARDVGLSRSIFAKRFNDFVGVPPIEYITRWRVQLAARLLDEGATIAETAGRVGYDSDATFSRVFKRFAGAPPATWRRARPKTREEAEYGGEADGEESYRRRSTPPRATSLEVPSKN
jgi:AraC-like DNA-binding protein